MRPPLRSRARRLPALLALCSFALAGTAAAPAPPPVETGSVVGSVRDTVGVPIAGAQVVVKGTALWARTDARGIYRLAAVPVGPQLLRAAHDGYRATESGLTVRPGKTSTVDFTLSPVTTAPQPLTELERNAPKTTDEASTMARPRADQRGGTSLFLPGVSAPAAAPWQWPTEPGNTEAYSVINDNRFLGVAGNPLSTFSIDVDAASYSNVRRFLGAGTLPPKDAVRLEELVNYFTYRYPDRSGAHPFAVSTEVGPCPWSPAHRIVRIGLQARRVDTRELPPSNLVFLIDVSGSMQTPDKLPLVKQAFRTLVQELRPEDRVAIVVYAGAAGLVLPSTSGAEKPTILAAIDRLEAGGSTAGGAGLRLAYDVAREHFEEGGNNRVILATDGDFNVGVSSDAEMVRLVERRREEGTFLTVLGFGTGNLKDSKMEQMADKGNGHYAYIDSFREAQKVFVREFGGTLFTVAKDVKIQVEFNPARVQSYRLLGYENRLLAKEDFADDRKDAGELGAGHAVTALYEVVPAGSEPAPDDGLTYQTTTVRPSARHSDELLTVRVRYKEPQGSRSRQLTAAVVDRGGRTGSEDFRFAAAVAEFAMLLRESEDRGSARYEQVLTLARGARGWDPEGYRGEFIGLVQAARAIPGVASAE